MSTYAVSRRIVLADLIPGAWVRDASLVAGGAGLTGLAAQISIHTSLSPVPFTLQTVAALLVGATLGSARGLLSMALYLVAGGLGLPWFASHSHGWGGTSFGYIVGFVVAAAATGWLAERRADRHVLTTILMMIVGNLIIYVIGVSWLLHQVPSFSVGQGLHYGMVVFLASDAAKTIAAALLLPAIWKVVKRDWPGRGSRALSRVK